MDTPATPTTNTGAGFQIKLHKRGLIFCEYSLEAAPCDKETLAIVVSPPPQKNPYATNNPNPSI